MYSSGNCYLKRAGTVGQAAIDEANAIAAKAHATTQPADLTFWLQQVGPAAERATQVVAQLKAEKK